MVTLFYLRGCPSLLFDKYFAFFLSIELINLHKLIEQIIILARYQEIRHCPFIG